MRLSRDKSSWRARGILRRDYRHDFSTPEEPKGHPPKRRRKPKAKRVHEGKHVWGEKKSHNPWYLDWADDRPTYYHYQLCMVPGCKARKNTINQRYGYEMWKWRKKLVREGKRDPYT